MTILIHNIKWQDTAENCKKKTGQNLHDWFSQDILSYPMESIIHKTQSEKLDFIKL